MSVPAMKNCNYFPALPRAATRTVAALMCASGIFSGCASLLPKAAAAPTLYTLESAVTSPSTQPAPSAATLTLVVNTPRADAGFDSQHMMYVREPYKLEYFAHNEWVDTPARMLAPLIVAAVSNRGVFKAVVPASAGPSGELTLDTEIVRLQQDFSVRPSRVVFTLRAYALATVTRKTIIWREIETVVVAESDDPLGGVAAANRAVQAALQQVADFCTEAERLWQTSTTPLTK
jgi:cholesterol transport system auxiliary component